MFSSFPREINRKLVMNKVQALAMINELNGKQNVYTSVFAFEKTRDVTYDNKTILKADYESAIIDKIFFDFDSNGCFENVKKMHSFLMEHDIMHCIYFSGRGFHLYIMTEEQSDFKFKKDCYWNAGKFFAEMSGLTIGKGEQFDLDSSTIGDLARITRYPNTYNVKRQRFCIPLKNDDILDYEYIKKEALTQRDFFIHLFGTKKIQLDYFDHPKLQHYENGEMIEITIPNLLPDDIPVEYGDEKFYPCVKKMIVERSGFQGWFYGVLWLRDKMGCTEQEAHAIMKKYLSRFKRTDGFNNDYQHIVHSDMTIKTVYSDKQNKYNFPRCESLWQQGWCPGKCPNFNRIYFSRMK